MIVPWLMDNKASRGRGIFYAVFANGIWGMMPLYWRLFPTVNPLVLLAFRILFSFLFVAAFLLSQRNTRWLGVFRKPKTGFPILLSSLLISFNWGLYIWAVNADHTIEASLGYYIHPLVYILLGLLLFRERLAPLQWIAFAAAAAGVALLTVFSGTFPWISLGLALSFSFYGLLKKRLTISSLDALGAETLAAVPLAILLLCIPLDPSPAGKGLSLAILGGLIPSGLITAIPLYCFAQGIRILPLSAMGFIQFISPTIQFLLGVFAFGESFPAKNLTAFIFIWISVILYSVSLMLKSRLRPVRGTGVLSDPKV